MTLPVVLDADGLDALADPSPPSAFRALLREALDRGRDVLVPAVVCAEACRGPARTRRVETALARHRPTRGQRPPVTVVDTDFGFARQVGAVLHGAGAGSADLADAHVVAVCARRGGGLVITSDPDDIVRLAAAVPAARVVTRPAR
ncbi:MAG: VapC toxin family PIN domain ribonuclease [Pseudonocardiales bacterium]|nr:type II toxin-antitoxin system VapC family toxin [Actinomycetota bacterium]PZS21065.1 MAG: VapC toxin family PIN domain ribonuclease [Pseudonocardiales bacterium]